MLYKKQVWGEKQEQKHENSPLWKRWEDISMVEI